ncbi:MAG: iron-sulfur cluster insertion protein ErpA [Candidatus Tectomicrobia bacterium]|uniref:Iron-sulfur cluster insertion protein ErpA n=1 Tax=Tectimicrobiota bacterium TaxID=2528274 RepID=A0A932HWK9_UNCTE|nr:iron-sulfur cluster insertion protein ErpA [Candidatus Tectomicrobia bacterium]
MSGPITLFDATKPKTAEGITITPAAQEKVNEILKAEGKAGHGLRVAVTAGGCSGHSYGLYFDEKAEAGDIVIKAEGFDIFVDPQSLQLLAGARIDYVDSIQGAGFKIENPNATSSCGCGKSFT